MIALNITPKLVALLADVLPVGDCQPPSVVVGSYWPNGYWRRIRASYPNGWDLVLNFNKQGNISSSRGTTRMRIKAKAAA